MAYSVNKLVTKAECDSLIADVQAQKADLQFQQTTLQHQQTNYSGTNSDVDIEFNSVTTELTGVGNIISTLPDGKTKDSYLKKQAALTHRKLVLEGKKENYGAVAQLQTEFELAQVALQIAEADRFIGTLQDRKNDLPS